MTIKVAPSILSADFGALANEVHRVEEAGADWVHVDVMDGMFVPNITIGPEVIKKIRPHTRLPFDVHLMIVQPERYIDSFSKSGADFITIHVEASEKVSQTLANIRSLGRKAGISINPETPFDAVRPHLKEIDLLLIMTVHPGFGGQSFIDDVVPKITLAREYADQNGLDFDIEIDGGINATTGLRCIKAGASALAAGSALFGSKDMKAEIAAWHKF
jgi:ribulose-phosphate 3-epimerase